MLCDDDYGRKLVIIYIFFYNTQIKNIIFQRYLYILCNLYIHIYNIFIYLHTFFVLFNLLDFLVSVKKIVNLLLKKLL